MRQGLIFLALLLLGGNSAVAWIPAPPTAANQSPPAADQKSPLEISSARITLLNLKGQPNLVAQLRLEPMSPETAGIKFHIRINADIFEGQCRALIKSTPEMGPSKKLIAACSSSLGPLELDLDLTPEMVQGHLTPTKLNLRAGDRVRLEGLEVHVKYIKMNSCAEQLEEPALALEEA